MGNRDIEDSLERSDGLTQEESRMASAEQLKRTHNIDDRVRGAAGGQVQDARGDVQDARGDLRNVGNVVQDVDDKLDKAQPFVFFQNPDCHSAGSDSFTGGWFRDSLLR